MGEIDVPSLRAAFDTASRYSEWSIIAVTTGVFIEFLALFIFSKEMPPLEKGVMIFATFLIVAGCGGEFIFGSRASDASSAAPTSVRPTNCGFKEGRGRSSISIRKNQNTTEYI